MVAPWVSAAGSRFGSDAAQDPLPVEEEPCLKGAFADPPASRPRQPTATSTASGPTAPKDDEDWDSDCEILKVPMDEDCDSDYDPAKPEYTHPASPEDVTRGLRSQSARQLGRLQAAVERRAARGDPKALDLCRHYSNVVRELKESAGLVAPQSAKVQCPVCLESTSGSRRLLLVTLQCGHPLCCSCAAKCAASGLSSCPVCRHPHLLDPELLSSRKEQWRQQYRNFRLGKSRGAHGEVTSVSAPAARTGPFPDAPAANAERGAAGSPALDVLAWTASLDRTAAHPVITFPGTGDLALARLSPLVPAPRAGAPVGKGGEGAPRGARAAGAAGCWSALGCLFQASSLFR